MSNFNILIIGGGFSGLTAALTIAKENPNISIALLEKSDIKNQDKQRDGRAFAISQSSLKLFSKIGILDQIKDFAGIIEDIKIVDGNSPFYLYFEGYSDSSNPTGKHLGMVIENYHIHNALRDQVLKQENITIFCPNFYKEITFDKNKALAKIDNNQIISANLVLACDGRFSAIREKFNIPTFQKSYRQNSLVFNISHKEPHKNIALEKFLPEGPFAVLPMRDSFESSIVWTVKRETAQALLALDEENFLQQFKKSIGDYLGEVKILTKPLKYNLDLIAAKKYYFERVVLIGDAAHAIHPIAGQGFNVGVNDIKFLSSLITQNLNCGLDIGSQTLLEKYQRVRKLDAGKMVLATDGLNALFSNKILPVKIARNLGLGIVEKIPLLKKFFIGNAGGK
jgi:2-octaprenyl-6-methoxyphenol hydroxylase